MTTSTEMRGVADPDEPGREYRINWKPVLVPYLKSRGPPAGGLARVVVRHSTQTDTALKRVQDRIVDVDEQN